MDEHASEQCLPDRKTRRSVGGGRAMHHCFTSRRARAYTVCRCGPLDPRPNVYVHPGLSCPACTSVSHVRSLALGDASTSTAEKVVVARISAGPPPSGRPGCEGGRIPFYLQERVRLFRVRSTTGLPASQPWAPRRLFATWPSPRGRVRYRRRTSRLFRHAFTTQASRRGAV